MLNPSPEASKTGSLDRAAREKMKASKTGSLFRAMVLKKICGACPDRHKPV
jgi:hypothetical protein